MLLSFCRLAISAKRFLVVFIMTYIKENIIAKFKKLYSPPRNLRVGNKSPTKNLFVSRFIDCSQKIHWKAWCENAFEGWLFETLGNYEDWLLEILENHQKDLSWSTILITAQLKHLHKSKCIIHKEIWHSILPWFNYDLNFKYTNAYSQHMRPVNCQNIMTGQNWRIYFENLKG